MTRRTAVTTGAAVLGFIPSAAYAVQIESQLDSVALRLESNADKDSKSLVVDVILANKTASDLQIWDPEKAIGRGNLSFILHDLSGAMLRIVRNEVAGDQGGKPIRRFIKAGEECRFRFNLLDGSWRLPLCIGAGNTRRISVEYDVAGGRLVKANGIWAGHLASEIVELPLEIRFYCPALVFPF